MRIARRRELLWGILLATVIVPGARAADDLNQRLAKAPELKVEEVCTPVTTTRQGVLMWAPNPDGKTWDILQWYFRGYGGPTQVFIMDLGTGEIKQDGIANRRQIHICGRALAPNGKLFIATPDWNVGMNFWVYDPADNSLTDLGILVPDLSGETRPMALAPDGMIYGGGSVFKEHKAGIYQLDPNTNKVVNYGPVGPAHKGGVWGYSIAADERYVYVASGKIPWWLVAYDRQTGKDHVVLTVDNPGGYLAAAQRPTGPMAMVRGVPEGKGKDLWYWLHEGKAIKVEEGQGHPNKGFKLPKVPSPPRPEVSTALSVPDEKGMAEVWYRTPEAKAAAPKAPAGDASLEALGWKKFRFEVPTYPTGTHRLAELPDGRILGTAGAYEGNFIYDPKADACEHMGKIGLSHYATTLHDGLIYMSGYPSSKLYVYDPAKPWSANKHLGNLKTMQERHTDSNPRMLCYLGDKKHAGTHKMYAAVTGADGKVYFGGRWIRDGSGGGLGWWDPQKQEAGGMWQPFSNYQITHMTTAQDGKLIVISTRLVNDPILKKPTPEQGRLILFDVTKGEIVGGFDPIPKAVGTGYVVGTGANRVIGWTVDPTEEKKNTSSILYAVDVADAKVLRTKKIDQRLPIHIGANQMENHDFRLGPDGKVWTFIRNVLVRIAPEDLSIEPVGRVRRGGRIAFSGKDIYLSGSTALRRIRGVAP